MKIGAYPFPGRGDQDVSLQVENRGRDTHCFPEVLKQVLCLANINQVGQIIGWTH
jgi:hypothetical protein